ncbi:hypothetical protein KSP39_PZI001982 [Platanthera zijinensis]|uniref:Uncharacterized protein n=1 Tax=Platanthera zijinensis TaxID=2320716 RepID=A0AAP0C120_9ASPA
MQFEAGDLVVNAMIVAVVVNSYRISQFIYHVSSSVRNRVKYSTLEQDQHSYLMRNSQTGRDEKAIKAKRIHVLKTMF